MQYTYAQLEEIAQAVRSLWASCYQGTILPGMPKGILSTGAKAYSDLLNPDRVQVFGGSGTSIPLQAIIAMGQEGMEEALRIQKGYAPFDMKPGFLKSPKAKTGKNGRYMVLSFRHMTPGATTRQGGVMSTDIHKQAKKGETFKDSGIGARSKLKKAIDIRAEKFGSSETMQDDYTWRNGIYAGMTKATPHKGKRHSSYRTFRVISDNSNPSAWWHPGQDPNDVVGSVVNYVKPFVAQGLKQAVKKDVINMIQQAYNR